MKAIPRFSIASILWLTAAVAVAAAYPRMYVERRISVGGETFSLGRVYASVWHELISRALIAAFLLSMFWLGQWAARRFFRRRELRLRKSFRLD
jgi:hypothetical protein